MTIKNVITVFITKSGRRMDYQDFFTSLFLRLKVREALNGGVFNRDELTSGFSYRGRTVTLIGATGNCMVNKGGIGSRPT